MVPQGKKQPPLESKVDEHPRATSMAALSALPLAFVPGGTVTAGNASGRNDGAAFVLMMIPGESRSPRVQSMIPYSGDNEPFFCSIPWAIRRL